MQLDRDVRALVGYLTSLTAWPIRDKFARLSEMATLLSLEKVCNYYWGRERSEAAVLPGLFLVLEPTQWSRSWWSTGVPGPGLQVVQILLVHRWSKRTPIPSTEQSNMLRSVYRVM